LRLWNSTFVVKKFVAFEGDGGEVLIVDSFQVGVKGGRDVGTLNFHHELALVHVIAQSDTEGDDTAIGEREDRNFAGDIRVDCSGYLKLTSNLLRHGVYELKALSTFYVHGVGSASLLDLNGGGGCFGGGGGCLMFAAEENKEKEGRCDRTAQGDTVSPRACQVVLFFQRHIHSLLVAAVDKVAESKYFQGNPGGIHVVPRVVYLPMRLFIFR
jgi:hypothetical protein